MQQIFLVLCLLCFQSMHAKIDPRELKCLVCEKTIEEISNAVAKLDPNLVVESGGYRLDAGGNIKTKSVPQTRSEIHLSELMDGVCEKMDDYVRATWKDTGKLTLLKLIGADGQMSMDMPKVDIIQDSDLNKSLKYYCEGLIEEYEDEIIQNFVNEEKEIDLKICTESTRYCSNSERFNEEL